jgi:HD-like signal output (HDOD) protein
MDLARTKGIPVFEAEKEVLGVTHAEAGAYLMGLWGLPEEIVRGIAFHHAPQPGTDKSFAHCGIIHVADLMDHQDQLHPQGWDQLEGLDQAYMEKIGMADRIPLWRDYLRSQSA